MTYEAAAPKWNHIGWARGFDVGLDREDDDDQSPSTVPRTIETKVSDPWRCGRGPRGRRFSYPVHDHAMRVLESERRLCMQKRREPKGRAPSQTF